MIHASIITIGTELTSGYVGDLNSTRISNALLDVDVACDHFFAVPDIMTDVLKALEWASGSDLVLITGGLGPTEDDMTREALAQFFGLELVLDETAANAIRNRLLAHGKDASQAILKQAQKPAGAELIAPDRGTAPGIILRRPETLFIALPGVPREVDEMMPFVKSTIQGSFKGLRSVRRERVFLLGPSEVDVEGAISDLLPAPIGARYNILSTLRGVEVNLFSDDEEGDHFVTGLLERIDLRLGPKIYSRDGSNMETEVDRLLRKTGLTLAVAESCTGGLVSERITTISGASEHFKGAVVSYANEVKETLLSVPTDVIDEMGAVSRETAIYMARNVRLTLGADLGISVTGIAGPTGGTPAKPVGLVYIALASAGDTRVEELHLKGDRERIRYQSSQHVLDLLRRYLLGSGGAPGEH